MENSYIAKSKIYDIWQMPIYIVKIAIFGKKCWQMPNYNIVNLANIYINTNSEMANFTGKCLIY